jgi:hypothetical protein
MMTETSKRAGVYCRISRDRDGDMLGVNANARTA